MKHLFLSVLLFVLGFTPVYSQQVPQQNKSEEQSLEQVASQKTIETLALYSKTLSKIDFNQITRLSSERKTNFSTLKTEIKNNIDKIINKSKLGQDADSELKYYNDVKTKTAIEYFINYKTNRALLEGTFAELFPPKQTDPETKSVNLVSFKSSKKIYMALTTELYEALLENLNSADPRLFNQTMFLMTLGNAEKLRAYIDKRCADIAEIEGSSVKGLKDAGKSMADTQGVLEYAYQSLVGKFNLIKKSVNKAGAVINGKADLTTGIYLFSVNWTFPVDRVTEPVYAGTSKISKSAKRALSYLSNSYLFGLDVIVHNQLLYVPSISETNQTTRTPEFKLHKLTTPTTVGGQVIPAIDITQMEESIKEGIAAENLDFDKKYDPNSINDTRKELDAKTGSEYFKAYIQILANTEMLISDYAKKSNCYSKEAQKKVAEVIEEGKVVATACTGVLSVASYIPYVGPYAMATLIIIGVGDEAIMISHEIEQGVPGGEIAKNHGKSLALYVWMAATRTQRFSTLLKQAPLIRLEVSSYFAYDLGKALLEVSDQKKEIQKLLAAGEITEAQADLKNLDLLRSTITTITFFTHVVGGMPQEILASGRYAIQTHLENKAIEFINNYNLRGVGPKLFIIKEKNGRQFVIDENLKTFVELYKFKSENFLNKIAPVEKIKPTEVKISENKEIEDLSFVKDAVKTDKQAQNTSKTGTINKFFQDLKNLLGSQYETIISKPEFTKIMTEFDNVHNEPVLKQKNAKMAAAKEHFKQFLKDNNIDISTQKFDAICNGLFKGDNAVLGKDTPNNQNNKASFLDKLKNLLPKSNVNKISKDDVVFFVDHNGNYVKGTVIDLYKEGAGVEYNIWKNGRFEGKKHNFKSFSDITKVVRGNDKNISEGSEVFINTEQGNYIKAVVKEVAGKQAAIVVSGKPWWESFDKLYVIPREITKGVAISIDDKVFHIDDLVYIKTNDGYKYYGRIKDVYNKEGLIDVIDQYSNKGYSLDINSIVNITMLKKPISDVNKKSFTFNNTQIKSGDKVFIKTDIGKSYEGEISKIDLSVELADKTRTDFVDIILKEGTPPETITLRSIQLAYILEKPGTVVAKINGTEIKVGEEVTLTTGADKIDAIISGKGFERNQNNGSFYDVIYIKEPNTGERLHYPLDAIKQVNKKTIPLPYVQHVGLDGYIIKLQNNVVFTDYRGNKYQGTVSNIYKNAGGKDTFIVLSYNGRELPPINADHIKLVEIKSAEKPSSVNQSPDDTNVGNVVSADQRSNHDVVNIEKTNLSVGSSILIPRSNGKYSLGTVEGTIDKNSSKVVFDSEEPGMVGRKDISNKFLYPANNSNKKTIKVTDGDIKIKKGDINNFVTTEGNKYVGKVEEIFQTKSSTGEETWIKLVDGSYLKYSDLKSSTPIRKIEGHTWDFTAKGWSFKHKEYTLRYYGFAQWDPQNITLPKAAFQGVKLHISANYDNAPLVADIVLPILRREGVSHKLVEDLKNLKEMDEEFYGDFSQGGKFITIYTINDSETVRIAKIIDDALIENGFKSKNFIKIGGEVYAGKSGGVFARYASARFDYVFLTNKQGFALDKVGNMLRYTEGPDRGKPINLTTNELPILNNYYSDGRLIPKGVLLQRGEKTLYDITLEYIFDKGVSINDPRGNPVAIPSWANNPFEGMILLPYNIKILPPKELFIFPQFQLMAA